MKGNKISDPNFIVYDANNIPNRFVKKFKHLPLIGLDVDSLEKYDKVLKYCDNIIFEKIRPNM